MKKLGKVTRIYRGKLLLINAQQARKPPRIGDPVLMPDGTPAGKVVDVIGPIDNPYVLVLPHPRFRPDRLLGRELYYQPPRKPGATRKHRSPPRRPGPRGRMRRRGGRG